MISKISVFDQKNTFGMTLTPIASSQNGFALPLTLVLLLVMTLAAVATLRSTTLEENMSANSRLRQIAFNAGESTLAEAERFLVSLRGQERRARFFNPGQIRPSDSVESLGDTCTDGYCTPPKYTSAISQIQPNIDRSERWEDPGLDVWNTDSRHMVYSNYANSGLATEGVLEAPRYIIEFLGNFDGRLLDSEFSSNPSIRPKFSGNFRGNCRDAQGIDLEAPNDVWPYCASDPSVYRITVRATAGPAARQSVIFLQSTLLVPN